MCGPGEKLSSPIKTPEELQAVRELQYANADSEWLGSSQLVVVTSPSWLSQFPFDSRQPKLQPFWAHTSPRRINGCHQNYTRDQCVPYDVGC